MTDCLTYTISEGVDEYLIHRGINKKKFFSRYLNIAKWVWQDIFQKTLWVVNSQWMPLKDGYPYAYIDVPKGTSTIFSVGVTDDCNLIQPLFYNPQLNVLSKPVEKKCGCRDCDCAGLCNEVNSLQVTTKLLFTINGVEYFQKTWVEYCKNGDVLIWEEIPTKKYNTLVGDAGDFNDDFNNDYLIGAAPFSDYTIITVKNQRKLCKLNVKSCGCPVDDEKNKQVFMDCCGFLLDWGCHSKKRHCDQFSQNINNNHFGEVKISDCGTKIFFRPSRKWKYATDKKFPDYLLVNSQTNGQYVGQEIQIPTYALMAFWAGLDYRSKVFNDKYNRFEKKDAEYKYNDEKLQVVSFLNPISLIQMSEIQDIAIRW